MAENKKNLSVKYDTFKIVAGLTRFCKKNIEKQYYNNMGNNICEIMERI